MDKIQLLLFSWSQKSNLKFDENQHISKINAGPKQGGHSNSTKFANVCIRAYPVKFKIVKISGNFPN